MFDEYKVIIIIGASNSGKSSLVKNLFFTNPQEFALERDIMPYTANGSIALIGNYFTNKRRVGTDTIERKQVGNLALQIKSLLDKGMSQVILEGMRCVSRPMIKSLLASNIFPLIIYVSCDKDVLLARAIKIPDVKLTAQELKRDIRRDTSRCLNFINDIKTNDEYVYKDVIEVKRGDFSMKASGVKKFLDVLCIESDIITNFEDFGKDSTQFKIYIDYFSCNYIKVDLW